MRAENPTNESAMTTPDPTARSILVVAPRTQAEHLVRALEGLPATIRAVHAAHELHASLTADTLAIVTALADEALLDALADEDRTAVLPVLVVVDDGFAHARARELHTRGAAVVLAWPSEVRFLPRLVLGLSTAGLATRRRQTADVALDAAIAARIAADDTPADALSCRVTGGVATLRGRTDSPWRAGRLRELVAGVPGIERVQADELLVIPPVVPDEELGDTIGDVIRSALGDGAIATIAVDARAGVVTLTGTLRSDAERRQLAGVVENVPGVAHVHDQTTVPEEPAG